MLETIEGWQAGTDHKRTVEKLHKGRIERAKSGHVVPTGCTPFGYQKVRDEKTRHYKFEIIEDEAEVVRQIFNWYMFGDESGKAMGTTRIAAKLSRMRVESHADRRSNKAAGKRLKRGEWGETTIREILKNETYMGVWRYAKKQNVKRDYVGQNEPVDIPVEVPAIISRELFELARQRRESRGKVCNRRKYNYLLVGYLWTLDKNIQDCKTE